MNDLERAVRQTLSARVSRLTDDRLDADAYANADVATPAPGPASTHPRRAWALPLAAAAGVAAIAVGVVVTVNPGNHVADQAATKPGGSTTAPPTPVRPPGPLADTAWQPDTITVGGHPYQVAGALWASVDIYQLQSRTATSADTYQVLANIGCGSVYAALSIKDGAVEVGPVRQVRQQVCHSFQDDLKPQATVALQHFATALAAVDHQVIDHGSLRLTGARGTSVSLHHSKLGLNFPGATVLAAGTYGSGAYTFAYQPDSKYGPGLDRIWSFGRDDTVSGDGVPRTRDAACVAAGQPDSRVSAYFVFGWTESAAVKVTYVAPNGGTPISLPVYNVRGAALRAYGDLVVHARGGAQITSYDARGHVLSQRPVRICS
jgi:hypothetical protein